MSTTIRKIRLINFKRFRDYTVIITYTNANFDNLSRKIAEKFNGKWPENITLMRYFPFLYQFCYKPFLSDQVGARGVVFGQKPNQYVSKKYRDYYLTKNGYFYDNRLALFLEKVIDDIKERIEGYSSADKQFPQLQKSYCN